MAEWIERLVDGWGPAAIAFLMFLETIFPPIPSELIMPLAGMEAAEGRIGLAAAIAAGTAGAMAGNLGWYLVARRAGLARVRRFVARHGRWLTVSHRSLERADRLFDRGAIWFVALGRVVPTIRSLVSIPAGLFGMGLVPFLLASTLGSALWTGALAWAGYALAERYQAIGQWMQPVSTAILAAILLTYVIRLARRPG